MGNLNLKQKQTIETKRLIIDTVFTLLKEQPLDEITIQSIDNMMYGTHIWIGTCMTCNQKNNGSNNS